ncbi:MAG: hypothetical protein Q9159_004661 [Coniocarpon cinnabarinum]
MSYGLHNDHWMERSSYGGQQHSPMEEYSQYGFASSPPSQSGYMTASMHPSRPALQPIVTTPWPSVLASHQNQQQQQQQHQQQQHPHQDVYSAQAHSVHAIHLPQPMQTSPASASPHTASGYTSQATTTPRRTLTDNDRRKMCQYHQEHPTKKQTEIGGELASLNDPIFTTLTLHREVWCRKKVSQRLLQPRLMYAALIHEHSTVSKVLRQKEKYLRTTMDSNQSPVKASKKNKPDLDRALAKWAANQQSKGVRITDENIKNQARFFWHAAGNTSDLPVKIDSPSWLEKFKQKNGLTLGSASPGAASEAGGDESTISPTEDTPISPEEALSRHVSPTTAASSTDMQHLRRQPSSGFDGLGIRSAAVRVPNHSQSNTSLSSAFTADTGATAFSSENTSVGSPVISPDALHSATSYFPSGQAPIASVPPVSRSGSAASSITSVTTAADNSIRPRSSTFPLASAADPYISPPQSANTSSPLNTSTAAVFDSPIAADMPPPPPPPPQPPHLHGKLPNTPAHHSPLSPHASYAGSQRHPVLSKTKSTPHLSTSLRHANATPPSFGDAKRGLEMAVNYLKSQGLGNDSADVAALRSVIMKMQVGHASGGSGVPNVRSHSIGGSELPGGLHRIPEMELQGEDSEMTGVGVMEEGEEEEEEERVMR